MVGLLHTAQYLRGGTAFPDRGDMVGLLHMALLEGWGSTPFGGDIVGLFVYLLYKIGEETPPFPSRIRQVEEVLP